MITFKKANQKRQIKIYLINKNKTKQKTKQKIII